MENSPFRARDIGNPYGEILLFRLAPRISSHQHLNFEFIYVLQGTAVRKIQNLEIPLRAGDFYLNPPFHIHGYTNAKDMKVINCYFAPMFLEQMFPESPVIPSAMTPHRPAATAAQVGLSIINQVFHDSDGTVRQILLKMEKEFKNRHAGYNELLRSYLTQILVYIYRTLEPRFSNHAISQIMDFLKEHYVESISLDSLSQLVGYTPQYVSKLFNREVGMNFRDYLQRYRVDQACVLLSNTDMSTAEVAAAVGYQDARHFSKIFRRYANISAHEYRKKHKQ